MIPDCCVLVLLDASTFSVCFQMHETESGAGVAPFVFKKLFPVVTKPNFRIKTSRLDTYLMRVYLDF